MSKEYLHVLKECVIETGKNSLRYLEGSFDVGSKASHKELVTFVDHQNEQMIIQRIKENFPHHKIMGEESYTGETFESNDFIWIVDPIDGTTNYLHQKQTFAISIALYQKGQGICGAVYNPSSDELFWAEKGSGAYLNNKRLLMNSTSVALAQSLISAFIRYDQQERRVGFERFVHHIANESRGIRMIGCGSLELAYVACGRFNAYFSSFQKPWDFAAGKLLVEEAGGKISCLNGDPIDIYMVGNSILAASRDLHLEMLNIYMEIL